MAAVRAHAEGRQGLGEVYVRLFNNPPVAEKVGALGEHLRFHGVLPEDVRELVVLRYAARQRFGYVWSHHQRPARLAGLDEASIAAMTTGEIPDGLRDDQQAALRAVDAVVAHESIPGDVQRRLVAAHGAAGAVEVVALCGLYAIMGYAVCAFDIPVEEGLPQAPWE
jgi:alkylhydroperoxidase family enzyme